MLSVMLSYDFLSKILCPVMLCLWYLVIHYAGIICEQNLMIHHEIDHILLENHSTPQISTISSILVKNLESRKACMDEWKTEVVVYSI